MAVRRRKAPVRAAWREEARAQIHVLKLIKQLEDHAFGKLELRPTQVSAALGLLKKALPDVGKGAVRGDGKKPQKLVIAWRGVRG